MGLTLGLGLAASTAPSAAGTADASADLYLVTLAGPGVAGYDGTLSRPDYRTQERLQQDDTLDAVGAGEPAYRWFTALDGYAVRLTEEQAHALADDPRVATVERNEVRRLTGRPAPVSGLTDDAPSGHGGAGIVIGVVDSGLWPGSPAFADWRGLGRAPRGFHGGCASGEGWGADTCNRKIVGARWFVSGFGADHVRASARLSPLDDTGHGTLMASIAAGNAGVSVEAPGQRTGQYAGVAPQARIAVYKACWGAPDPRDDGCATADLVTAIDRATRDGVDVLSLSVAGPPEVDTVERALLGATESGAVVVAAAGNDGDRAYAAHPSPWVTTVGATNGAQHVGRVTLPGGPMLLGAMSSRRTAGPARVVVGADVPAPGASVDQARVCTPGSLDAARVHGRIVLCDRGVIGRVDKSTAVQQADGVGMILVNTARGSVNADFHRVPTVHLAERPGEELRAWLARHPGARVTLSPDGTHRYRPRVMGWSSGGDPTGAVLKPDVVAPGTGLLGATPPSSAGLRWDYAAGTSAATADTAGVAARLLALHGWSAAEVRSALATTARSVTGTSAGLREGAGKVHPEAALTPGLGYLATPREYRAWLDGHLRDDRLNTPSVLLTGGDRRTTRTVTNLTHHRVDYAARTSGFERHIVTVNPSVIHLAPGQSVTFRVRVSTPPRIVPLDDGRLVWRGTGPRVSIPVVITR